MNERPRKDRGSGGSIHDSLGDGTAVGSLGEDPERVIDNILAEIEALAENSDLLASDRFRAIAKKVRAVRRILRSVSDTSYDGNRCITPTKQSPKKT